MRTIAKDGRTYAIIHLTSEWKERLDFLTPPNCFCQVGTWHYSKGKRLRQHRHIHNERVSTLTQECVVVMQGSVQVDFYDDDNKVFCSETLKRGDLAIMLSGGHGYEILEDNTKIVECKNGPFVSVGKDKELI